MFGSEYAAALICVGSLLVENIFSFLTAKFLIICVRLPCTIREFNRSWSEMWHRAQTCSLLLSRNILMFAKSFQFSAPIPPDKVRLHQS